MGGGGEGEYGLRETISRRGLLKNICFLICCDHVKVKVNNLSDRGLIIHGRGGKNLLIRPKHVNKARAETSCDDKDNKIVKIVICLFGRSGN